MDISDARELRYRRAEKPYSAVAHAAHSLTEQKMGALVVDDNNSIRYLVSCVLLDMGIEVTAARDGEEALALFREHTFDIVLTDWNMPHMDGLSLARQIKMLSPLTPIILMTGEAGMGGLSEARDVDDVMFKPFGIWDVVKRVRKMFSQ